MQELIETPVALVSTSPEREDTILVRDPFVDCGGKFAFCSRNYGVADGFGGVVGFAGAGDVARVRALPELPELVSPELWLWL